jgi:hypothetical protein
MARTIRITEGNIDSLLERVEILEAVCILEYHDKNWLAWDDKRLSEEKIKLTIDIKRSLLIMKDMVNVQP